MNNIKLVIFDLDGTLINSVADLGQACNYALQKHGYPQHEAKAYNYFVGNGINKLIERALPPEKNNPDEIMAVKADFMTYYMQHKTDLTHPYEGIPELLAELQKREVKIAVASNKFIDGTRALVKNFFPDINFCAVLGQRESIPIKPDPFIANEALAAAQVSRSQALYVGDTCVDIKTAQNAAIEAVGVTWGFRPVEELIDAGATHIINTPSELLKLI